jgi:hypothetical protein
MRRYIKYFEGNHDTEIFYQLVFDMVEEIVINMYDLFQEYSDNDISEMVIHVCTQSPESIDDDFSPVDLFTIDRNIKISATHGDDYIQSYFQSSDYYNLFDRKDVIFELEFRYPKNSDSNRDADHRNDLINAADEFLSKLNSMYNYQYIHHKMDNFRLYDQFTYCLWCKVD